MSFICIHNILKTKKQKVYIGHCLTHLNKTTCQIIHNTPFSLSLSFNMLLQHDLSYHKQTQDYLFFFYFAVNRTTCTGIMFRIRCISESVKSVEADPDLELHVSLGALFFSLQNRWISRASTIHGSAREAREQG